MLSLLSVKFALLVSNQPYTLVPHRSLESSSSQSAVTYLKIY